ncbi:MAG TPA: DUF721 domain-containing protein [Syntrophales bacterium]|nr:DUF721 domain-containing protein [Syntrophales bacterium]HPQ45295.1 DUF721 domain-containing protein [Syntrophales bacterium]
MNCCAKKAIMYQRRRSGKRQRNLQKMGDFLETILKRKKILLDLIDYRILDVWKRSVGPQISANTNPFKFKNNTLFVHVSSPAWMQQLRFMKQEIMDKVNLEWEKEEIKNIYFSIGDIHHTPVKTAEHHIDFTRYPLKERDKRLIRENLSQIGDEELKGILERVMKKEIVKRRMND